MDSIRFLNTVNNKKQLIKSKQFRLSWKRNSSTKSEHLLNIKIQDVEEFVSSSDLEKSSITSLAHQWILYSEWVPSEWESKQLKKYITIIYK